jgi:hypothetical protein
MLFAIAKNEKHQQNQSDVVAVPGYLQIGI